MKKIVKFSAYMLKNVLSFTRYLALCKQIKQVMGSAFIFIKLTVKHSQFINIKIIYFTWLRRQLVLHLLRQKCSNYGGCFLECPIFVFLWICSCSIDN